MVNVFFFLRPPMKKEKENSHLSSTCGGSPCPESARSSPEGAGRPSIGRKAEAAEDEEEEKTEEAEGARGNCGGSGCSGCPDLTKTETRPALAARRRKAAPERKALFSFRGSRGRGEAAAGASASKAGGDIFFFGGGGSKTGKEKK
jgi:hypothetical protein